MSSHREAPEISKDPVADSTDLYAFTSYGNPDNVTIIANYVPLQAPDGGPNFYEFGDDVLYEIKIDNNGDGQADVTYQFTFTTQVTNPNTFLYNTGPILSLTDKNWNRRQTYTVVRVDDKGKSRRWARTSRARRATSGRCRHRTTRRWSTSADPRLAERRQRVRRPARRGLLRRPGRDLRPRHPATVPAAAHDVRARRTPGSARWRRE